MGGPTLHRAGDPFTLPGCNPEVRELQQFGSLHVHAFIAGSRRTVANSVFEEPLCSPPSEHQQTATTLTNLQCLLLWPCTSCVFLLGTFFPSLFSFFLLCIRWLLNETSQGVSGCYGLLLVLLSRLLPQPNELLLPLHSALPRFINAVWLPLIRRNQAFPLHLQAFSDSFLLNPVIAGWTPNC